MKRGRKTNLFRKIRKLQNSNDDTDISLARELLLGTIETMHPDEWTELNGDAWYSYSLYPEDIQKYLYDKRQSEGQSLRENRETTK